MAQWITDSLGDPTIAADRAEPHIEHASQVVDNYAATFLAGGTACIGRLTTDVGLNGIELCGACENVGCDRRFHPAA